MKHLVILPALVGLCGALASCTSTQVLRTEDYIGPLRQKVQAAPARPDAATTEAQAPATPPAVPPSGPLEVTVSDVILIALENNRALVVERFNPSIFRTFEQQQRAAFDPDFTAQYDFVRNKGIPLITPVTFPSQAIFSQVHVPQLGVTEFLPTGTTLTANAFSQISEFPLLPDTKFATTPSFSVTQSILRGFGLDVNLASLRQSRIDTLSTQYELHGFAEALVAQTEEAYWDYVLAQRQIEIFQHSLELAEQQLKETNTRIRLGTLAPIEAAAAEAEVALRHENLIDAKAALEVKRVQLLRLVSPPGSAPLGREIAAQDKPVAPDEPLDGLDQHLEAARQFRADLNQARLQVNRGDLEVVKTKNGLLPKLDLFASLGSTGYADSFGPSINHTTNDKNYELTAGILFEQAIGNRAAKAQYQRSVLSRDQSLEAVNNLAQLVEEDVRLAFIEINRAKEQVAATAVTTKYQKQKVDAELAKFGVGKSTTLLVGQAERDLLQAQINEVQAMVTYLKDFAELYRLEGTLLTRRGIASPGATPVKMTTNSVVSKVR